MRKNSTGHFCDNSIIGRDSLAITFQKLRFADWERMQPKHVGHFFVVALCEAQSSHCDAIDAITSSDVFFC